MSTAAAPAADAPAKKGGSKKLIIIIVAAVLLLALLGGGAAFFLMKKSADEQAEGEDGTEQVEKSAKKAKKSDEPKHPPTFVPLDPFTVNLADPGADRYLQVGLSLEIEDPKTAEDLKLYMPAIRNGVLMILSHKTSSELMTSEGKSKLAEEIRAEVARSMGIDIPEADAEEDPPADEEATPKKKKKKKKVEEEEVDNPIVHVHYSNFIIQ